MSLGVALRSVVFYVVACTPCTKFRHRQKARNASKKERLEKAIRLETEQPGRYQHPSPFTTNPYWQEEIERGPSLPKKSASKSSSSRGLTSAGRDSCSPSVSEQTNVEDSRTNVDSMSILREEEDTVPSDWNRKKGYQREDEEVWGQWTAQKLVDALNKARNSAGRLIESTLGLEKEVTDQERRAFYATPRNPPVNDYHPAVISSRPANRDGIKWMLQPPPPAKFMEGKTPVSRATSSASKSSGRTLVSDDPFLRKVVKEQLAKEKLAKARAERAGKDAAVPTESELIESIFLTRTNQTATRCRSLSFDADIEDRSTEASSNDSGSWGPKSTAWVPKSHLAPVRMPYSKKYFTKDNGKEYDPNDPSDEEYPAINPDGTITFQKPKLETFLTTDAGPAGTQGGSTHRSRRSKLLASVGNPTLAKSETFVNYRRKRLVKHNRKKFMLQYFPSAVGDDSDY
ncbi:hypothetical protein A9K55_003499 [Cordyceps militaris]|uniref:Signal peptide-containing protein n=1 Tax=Cordyceps militaris TaxID=73501 RepID=A0A2H4S6S0_CORMI|nr:hypothetical protein A9K55_003499 [Cordyceps militaris]